MANKALTGLKNKNAGAYFEKMILASCRNYLDMGIAKIDKAHEPMKVIKVCRTVNISHVLRVNLNRILRERLQMAAPLCLKPNTRILIRWHMTGCKKRSLMRC